MIRFNFGFIFKNKKIKLLLPSIPTFLFSFLNQKASLSQKVFNVTWFVFYLATRLHTVVYELAGALQETRPKIWSVQ